ncbi:MAG: transposase, partial [Sporolactobacillus sp.]
GEGKRRFGLNRIYTMLRETSETVIALKFLVMNLERRLRVSLRFFTYLRTNVPSKLNFLHFSTR